MVLDSGATKSFVCAQHDHLMTNKTKICRNITTADGTTRQATQAGTLNITSHGTTMPIYDAMSTPFFQETLVSCASIVEQGHAVHLEKDNSCITLNDGTRIPVECNDATFYIHLDDAEHHHARAAKTDSELLALWHARLGDTAHKTIIKMINNKSAHGMPDSLSVTHPKHFCVVCAQAKARRKDRGKAIAVREPKYDLGESWSADIFGPLVLPNGKKWWVYLMVEELSRYSHANIIWDKTTATLVLAIQEVRTDVLAPLNFTLKRLHSDYAAEMRSVEMKGWLLHENIRRTHSAEYTASQNSLVERRIGILNQRITALCLRAPGMPAETQPYAVLHATHLMNVVPASRETRSPHETLHKAPPDLSDLVVWGSAVYYTTLPVAAGSRFKPKAKLGRIVRLLPDRKGYMIATAESGYRAFANSQHVRIIEQVQDGIPAVSETVTNVTGELPILHVENQLTSNAEAPRSYEPVQNIDVGAAQASPTPALPLATPAHEPPAQHDSATPSNTTTPVHAAAGTLNTTAPQSGPLSTTLSGDWARPTRTRGENKSGTKLRFPISVYNETYGPIESAARVFQIPVHHIDRQVIERARMALVDYDDFEKTSSNTLDAAESSMVDLFCTSLSIAHDEDHFVSLGDGTGIYVGEEVARARGATHANVVPKTYDEAIRSPKWLASVHREWNGIIDAGTFGAEERIPRGRISIPLKYGFKLKTDQHGNVVKDEDGIEVGYKTRIHMQGFRQRKGLDYEETFTNVTRVETLRILCALSVLTGRPMSGADITQAYLLASWDPKFAVYVTGPEGFENRKGYGRKLLKSLYGGKQSGRNWGAALDKILQNFGFQKFVKESSLYRYVNEETGQYILMAVYVDDLTWISSDDDIEKKFTDFLKDSLPKRRGKSVVKLLGQLQEVLNLKVDQRFDHKANRFAIHLSQGKYIRKLLDRFGIERASKSPANKDLLNIEPDHEATTDEINYYQQKIGSIIYAANGTNPAISHTTNRLCSVMHAPNKSAQEGADRLLRFLKIDPDVGLLYEHHGPPIILNFTNTARPGKNEPCHNKPCSVQMRSAHAEGRHAAIEAQLLRCHGTNYPNAHTSRTIPGPCSALRFKTSIQLA